MERTGYNKAYPYVPPEAERMRRIEKLAEWLDYRWKVPGMQFRIGIDGMLGLLPGIGDTLSVALSSYIIYEAHLLNAPWGVKAHMVWNVFVDWLVGLIPLVGDIFDFGWKANQKNADLLRRYLRRNAA